MSDAEGCKLKLISECKTGKDEKKTDKTIIQETLTNNSDEKSLNSTGGISKIPEEDEVNAALLQPSNQTATNKKLHDFPTSSLNEEELEEIADNSNMNRSSVHAEHESDYDNLSEPEENEILIPKATVRPNSLQHGDLSNIKIEFNNALNERNSTTYVPTSAENVPIKLIKTSNPEIEVLLNTPVEEERSWLRLMNNASRFLPQKRVQYLPNQGRNEGLPYKTWLLGLTKKHRIQIIIGLGICIWLAFFIFLVIFVYFNNSGAAESALGNKVDNDRTGANELQHQHIIKNMTFSNTTNLMTHNTVSIITTPTMTAWAGKEVVHNVSSAMETSVPSVIKLLKTITVANIIVGANVTTEKTAAPTQASTTNYNSPTTTNYNSPTTTNYNSPTTTNYNSPRTTAAQTAILNAINYTDIHQQFSSIDNLIKDKNPNYEIGIGRADMTGPAADVNMMGYANPSQTSGGIHFRQYSRAFIIAEKEKDKRVVFVNIDACMASTLLKLEVMKRVKELYGDLYREENVCISGTHTHSAPAGFLQDVLFQITSWGYVPETLTAMVNGIVKSIVSAHESIKPGFILINKGDLLDSNVNRSPTAYLFNPPHERARYKHNVDKDMTLLKFVDEHGKGRGMINWFPVHCTSMNNTNTLISGDNKGYAELLFEQEMDRDSLPGESSFVAAFAQSNEGDVSPNTNGPHCVGTNISCANNHSTCNGVVKDCIATGPGYDMFESTKIIANNQFQKALSLFNSVGLLLEGPVQFVHQYVNMTNYEVKLNNNRTVKTCKPAMGFSFAAGTTDGPGAFDFKQGDTSGSNMFWKIIRGFLHDPTDKQENCHAPKPILIDTGEMSSPYSWQPEVVANQIFRIGQLFVIAVPGEFTTMSGRRVRETVMKTLAEHFPDDKVEAVIAGLSNTYSDYIATFEEYQAQRYEGASTIYGPYTLHAYLDHYKKLTQLLATDTRPGKIAEPVNLLSKLKSFTTGVILDLPMTGYKIGDVIDDARSVYKMGEEVVVCFMAGNPRSSLKEKPEMHFSAVEMLQDDGTWKVIHNDASWDTKYIWIRTSTMFAQSEVTIKWKIDPLTTKPGKYRIRHDGHYKAWAYIYEYSGASKTFDVST